MDRRLGIRRPVTWLHLSWQVLRHGRWRGQLVEERISALDVSTSGMGVRAATVPSLKRGVVVELVLNGQIVPARVRRVVETDDPGTTAYGLEFVDPPAEFIETLLVHSTPGTGDEFQLSWRRAA